MKKHLISFLGVLGLSYSPSFPDLQYSHVKMIQDYLGDIKNWAKLSQANRNTLPEKFTKEIKRLGLTIHELKTATTEVRYHADNSRFGGESFRTTFSIPGFKDVKFCWESTGEDDQVFPFPTKEIIKKLGLVDPKTGQLYDEVELVDSCKPHGAGALYFQVLLEDIFKCLEVWGSTFEIILKEEFPAKTSIILSDISLEERFDKPAIFFWSIARFTEDAMDELGRHFASPYSLSKEADLEHKLIDLFYARVVGIDEYDLVLNIE